MGKQQSSEVAIRPAGNSTSLQSADKKKSAAIITSYLDLFAAIEDRKRDLTPDVYSSYVETIVGYRPALSDRQIEKGLKTYLETGKRFPWPSELIECMEEEV